MNFGNLGYNFLALHCVFHSACLVQFVDFSLCEAVPDLTLDLLYAASVRVPR